MGSTAKRVKRKFTWEDYKIWPDEERWEISEKELPRENAFAPSET